MTNLALVPEDKSEWLRCRPWIEAALKYNAGTHNIKDIEAGIESGAYWFFSSPRSAVVVEIIICPRMKVLNYFLIGGDSNELKTQIDPYVSAWAKARGCKIAIGNVRPGGERLFADIGFKARWTTISKELT